MSARPTIDGDPQIPQTDAEQIRSSPVVHVVLITAGGAGMFCGSCMHDNTWARALIAAGAEVSLLPTYTPIRVDEPDQSDRRVFFGGINVYLESRSRLWRRIPRALTRWLDAPWIIGLASRVAVSNDAQKLGALALDMLAGEEGPHVREIDELAAHVAALRPDVVVFSNALLCGALRRLKERSPARAYATLQGDDIFLEGLPEPYRSEAIRRLTQRSQQFDGYLVHSGYYRDFMSGYLGLPRERFHVLPLGIDLAGHDGVPGRKDARDFTVGYFARICPEKGLHRLVEAFHILHRRLPAARLKVGGYLGPRDEAYFRGVARDAAPLGDAFEHAGSPAAHAEKVAFFKSLDVLSVPTVYREPKGLYVLEALANGVPVVQPRHGAFPELIERTGGGVLVEPGNASELADTLQDLAQNGERRIALGSAGQANVRSRYDPRALAEATLAAFRS